MTTWVLVMEVESGTRPGLVERVGRIFADRGVSLTELLATACSAVPVVVLRFSASQSMCEYLERRLSRIEGVCGITRHPGEGRALTSFLNGTQGGLDRKGPLHDR